MDRLANIADSAIDELMSEWPSDVAELGQRVRGLLKTIAPDLIESPQYGWGSINFHHPQAGYVCGLFPKHTAVWLNFEWGVRIEDPLGLLQGSGKQCRHLVLPIGAPLPEVEIDDFMQQAVVLRILWK